MFEVLGLLCGQALDPGLGRSLLCDGPAVPYGYNVPPLQEHLSASHIHQGRRSTREGRIGWGAWDGPG